MWRRWPIFLIHASILCILAGGMLTWLTSDHGSVTLHKGKTVRTFTTNKGVIKPLPSGITLKEFRKEYYPESEIPSDFVSEVIAEGETHIISMNNIMDFHGYRLSQSSFTSQGDSILSVNHDPYGIPVVYCGFILFIAGFVLCMADRKGAFMTTLKKLREHPAAGLVILLAIMGTADAGAENIAGISREAGDSLGRKEVMYNGKIMTFSTVATDVVLKLYGKRNYRGLTPEQCVASLILFPEQWKNQPIMLVKDRTLRERLHLQGKYASMSDLFTPDGTYRLTPLLATGDEKSRQALLQLDEKAGIIIMLYTGELFTPIPGNERHLSDSRVEAELLNNRLPLSMLLFITLMIAAATCLIRARWSRWLYNFFYCIALLTATAEYALHWYISGHIPLSNMSETLLFLVICMTVGIGIYRLTAQQDADRAITGIMTLITGLIALMAHLNASNPAITPLMPVLSSGWLTLHVSIVMIAYSLLLLTAAVSASALVNGSKCLRLRQMQTQVLLYPAVLLLAAGIFTGSVWANVSWGRYWAWDPKETWALVTLLLYSLPLHRRFLYSKPRRYHIYLLICVSAIAMTYFGVNLLPGKSLHSY